MVYGLNIAGRFFCLFHSASDSLVEVAVLSEEKASVPHTNLILKYSNLVFDRNGSR